MHFLKTIVMLLEDQLVGTCWLQKPEFILYSSPGTNIEFIFLCNFSNSSTLQHLYFALYAVMDVNTCKSWIECNSSFLCWVLYKLDSNASDELWSLKHEITHFHLCCILYYCCQFSHYWTKINSRKIHADRAYNPLWHEEVHVVFECLFHCNYLSRELIVLSWEDLAGATWRYGSADKGTNRGGN